MHHADACCTHACGDHTPLKRRRNGGDEEENSFRSPPPSQRGLSAIDSPALSTQLSSMRPFATSPSPARAAGVAEAAAPRNQTQPRSRILIPVTTFGAVPSTSQRQPAGGSGLAGGFGLPEVQPQQSVGSLAQRRMRFVRGEQPPHPVRCTPPPDAAANDVHLQGGRLRVSFPADYPTGPQPPQRVVMEAVAQALLEGRHALVESPTGTGKTLALLCTALAHQSALKADPAVPRDKVPRIIWVSRTHDQLVNVIRELRKTKARRRALVLIFLWTIEATPRVNLSERSPQRRSSHPARVLAA